VTETIPCVRGDNREAKTTRNHPENWLHRNLHPAGGIFNN
jgi:hypothetical protein